MPFYQFTVPSGGATLAHKPEVAAAFTKVHSEITGAPATYVHCSFTEVAPQSIFVAGQPAETARMVGLIRSGRSPALRARLLHDLADAWCEITGDAKDELALFLVEIPGANAMEGGVVLPEITEDVGGIM